MALKTALYCLLMGQTRRPPMRPVESIVALMFFCGSRHRFRTNLVVEDIDGKIVEGVSHLSGEVL